MEGQKELAKLLKLNVDLMKEDDLEEAILARIDDLLRLESHVVPAFALKSVKKPIDSALMTLKISTQSHARWRKILTGNPFFSADSYCSKDWEGVANYLDDFYSSLQPICAASCPISHVDKLNKFFTNNELFDQQTQAYLNSKEFQRIVAGSSLLKEFSGSITSHKERIKSWDDWAKEFDLFLMGCMEDPVMKKKLFFKMGNGPEFKIFKRGGTEIVQNLKDHWNYKKMENEPKKRKLFEYE